MKFVSDGTREIHLWHMKYALRMKCASHMKERIVFHILPAAKNFIFYYVGHIPVSKRKRCTGKTM